MDEELRNLEHLAKLGDVDAIRRLKQLRKRMGIHKPKKSYHYLVWIARNDPSRFQNFKPNL